jgi:membrane protein DedA with SNARE-associated domain
MADPPWPFAEASFGGKQRSVTATMEQGGGYAAGAASGRPAPSRRTLMLIVVPLVALVVAANVGDALLPHLIPEHPLVFIMLNARNRNLALATNLLDPVSYYVVGTVRLLVSDPLFYLLGYFYGDAGVRWMERQAPTYGALLRKVEGWFGRAAYPLVAIAPNNFICRFAGAAGMSIPTFFALNLGGTIVRLAVIRALGDVFAGPINEILDFIKHYRWPLFAVTLSMVAISVLTERRRGTSELQSLTHLEDELQEAEEELEAEHERDELVDAALTVQVPEATAATVAADALLAATPTLPREEARASRRAMLALAALVDATVGAGWRATR